MLALKTFQQNQMHGNFNELVTTFMTEESEQLETEAEGAANKPKDVDPEEYYVAQIEVDVNIPSFEVELMKLKLDPVLKQVAKPRVFERWVTYQMLGMSMWMEKRTFDEDVKAQINKISLVDETM